MEKYLFGTKTTTIINNVEDLITSAMLSVSISSIIFASMFFFLNLSLKKIMSLKNISNFKKIIINLFFGFIVSFTTFAFFNLSQLLSTRFLITSQIMVFFVLSLFTSTYIFIGIFPIFLYVNTNFFINNPSFFINNNEFWFLIIIFLLCIFVVFISRYMFNNKFYLIIINLTFMFIILSFLEYLIFSLNEFYIYLALNIVDLITFSILFLIGSKLTNIIDNAFNLKTSIKYDNGIFVHNGYAKNSFQNYIKMNNIKTGLLLTFSFSNQDYILSKFGKNAQNEIQRNFIKYLYFHFGPDCFYFKTHKNDYALFFEISLKDISLKQSVIFNSLKERNETDFLKEYEMILERLPKYIDFNNDKFEIKFNCYGSIYGIHSTNFDELINNNEKTKLKYSTNKEHNIITLFNFEKSLNNNDIQNFKKIYNDLNLKEVILSLQENGYISFDVKSNIKFIKTKIIWNEKNIYLISDIEKEFMNLKLQNFIMRNIAYRSIKLFSKLENKNNYILVLDYPINYVKELNFNIENINYVFDYFKIKPDKIIFNFSLNNLKEIEKQILNNLEKIKKEKIRIAFNNFNYKKHKNYLVNADYLIFSNKKNISKQIEKLSKTKNIKIIFEQN